MTNILELSVNIDGLLLFNSSGKQFWPILGLIKNICSPFVIGIFCGTSKPEPLQLFLQELKDISSLMQHGLKYGNTVYEVKLYNFICDAPARAFVKCIKSHSGYSSCEKCAEHGSYIKGRVVFKSCSKAAKRTDETFILQSDEDHHIGISPLLELNIGLVSTFPIDYMHAVCLGVMRKLLHCWIGGNLNVRLRAYSVKLLSQSLLSLRPFIVKEINRKPRSLSELARWKAT
uniref:Uncharacterized protein LOC114339293 n=1 Tax=Diabrotica virgifera virgifera TaxID=50390 RepID=A0A6P7GIG5_DIAVI